MNSKTFAVNALKQMIGIDPKCIKLVPLVFPMEDGNEIVEALPDEVKNGYSIILGILNKTHEMAFMAGKTMGMAGM